MKTATLLIFAIATSGCATLGSVQGTQAVDTSRAAVTATDSGLASFNSSSQDQNIGPRIVIPATGGAPVIGIPLGGDMFLPVTGGAPVIGIPTTP
jgi:hypothetical protein